ncbi:hypothetical protein L596_026192 [Steinernema carpocapsae]|nr:hypothetical protein L596_026192 [Steinernema carpocapsae]
MEPYIKANLNASAWLTGGLFYNDKRGFQWAEPESQPATFTNWGRGFPDPSIKGYKYMVDPFSAVAQFAEVCKTPGAPGCQKIGKSGVEARFYWINTACNAELRYPICMIKDDGTFGQN